MAATRPTPKPAIDVSTYRNPPTFATARDGTRIPYAIIFRKGLKLDGGTPAWISAYGSYGAAAYTPAFAGRTLALIDAGFIVGYAYVRGGGEYGRDWHKAGQLANKPNTWRDLIDVCEDLYCQEIHGAITPGDRRAICGWHYRRARTHRAPRSLRRGDRRRRLVKSAALRRRTQRLRRGTGVGRDQRGTRLSRTPGDRQLPGGEAGRGLPRGAVDDRRD